MFVLQLIHFEKKKKKKKNEGKIKNDKKKNINIKKMFHWTNCVALLIMLIRDVDPIPVYGVYSQQVVAFLAYNVTDVLVVSIGMSVYGVSEISYKMLKQKLPCMYGPVVFTVFVSEFIISNICAGLISVTNSQLYILSIVLWWTAFCIITLVISATIVIQSLFAYYADTIKSLKIISSSNINENAMIPTFVSATTTTNIPNNNNNDNFVIRS